MKGGEGPGFARALARTGIGQRPPRNVCGGGSGTAA